MEANIEFMSPKVVKRVQPPNAIMFFHDADLFTVVG
jgi:hypothetical protein